MAVAALVSSCLRRNAASTSTMRTAQQQQQQLLLLRRGSSLAKKKKKVARVAVVGSGRMGKIRSKAIYANPKMELIGIIDEYDLNGAQAIADDLSTNAFSSILELVAHDKKKGKLSNNDNEQKQGSGGIDGIVCCTNTGTHASIIQQSLLIPPSSSTTLSSIFVEKPVDESASKIRELFRTIRDYNNDNCNYDGANQSVQLCCGFQRRFDPSYQRLLDESKNIGKIVNGTIFFGDHPCPPMEYLLHGGGDIFMDLSAHDIDFILQVMKKNKSNNVDGDDYVTSVYATGTSSLPELEVAKIHDNATMVLNFNSGAVVTIFMSRSAPYGYDQRCEVFGSKGMVQVGNINASSTIVSNQDGIHHSKYQHSFPQRFRDAFEMEMDAFADTILLDSESDESTKKIWPVTEKDCIEVQMIADAAQESCKTGQVVHIDYNNFQNEAEIEEGSHLYDEDEKMSAATVVASAS